MKQDKASPLLVELYRGILITKQNGFFWTVGKPFITLSKAKKAIDSFFGD